MRRARHVTAPTGHERRAAPGPSVPAEVLAAAHAVASRMPVPESMAEQVWAMGDDVNLVPRRVLDSLLRSPEAAARALEAASRATAAGPFGRLQDVVRAMGPRHLRVAFAGGETHSLFDPTPGPAGMSALAFGLRCAQVAEVSATVTRVAGAGSVADGAWTAGLLHDVGMAAITAAPSEAPPVGAVDARALHEFPLHRHPVLGAWMVARWRLSEDIVRAVRCHEDPRAPEGAIARAVWLAVRVVEARLGVISARDLGVAGVQFGLPPSQLEEITLGREPRFAPVGGEGLTLREAEVLGMLAEGMTPKQIGLELGLSGSTVHNHLHHVYGKLGVATQAQALLAAREKGWV